MLGSIVRRFVRATVVVIAALGLGAGGVLGLAAPAGADAAFTAVVESPAAIVAGTTTPIVFGGGKDTGAVITDVTVDNPTTQDLTASVCPTGGAGNTTWSCKYVPSSGYERANSSTIQIDYTNADGSAGKAVITFRVGPAPVPASTTPAPTRAAPTTKKPFVATPAPIAVVPATNRPDLTSASNFATAGFVATIKGSTDPGFSARGD